MLCCAVLCCAGKAFIIEYKILLIPVPCVLIPVPCVLLTHPPYCQKHALPETRPHYVSCIALVAEWLRVRLRVRMVRGSTLTVGNFLSLEKSECNNSGYKLTGLTWWP